MLGYSTIVPPSPEYGTAEIQDQDSGWSATGPTTEQTIELQGSRDTTRSRSDSGLTCDRIGPLAACQPVDRLLERSVQAKRIADALHNAPEELRTSPDTIYDISCSTRSGVGGVY